VRPRVVPISNPAYGSDITQIEGDANTYESPAKAGLFLLGESLGTRSVIRKRLLIGGRKMHSSSVTVFEKCGLTTAGNQEPDGSQTNSRGPRRQHGPAGNLQPLLQQFLVHLHDYRGCSPRTVAAYRQDAERFIDFLHGEGVYRAEDVQRQHAHRFAAELAHLAPASIRRKIYALRSWFGHLVDMGLLQTNVIASVQVPKQRQALPNVPTKEQCDALLAACRTPKEKLVVMLMLLAGLRKSEVLSLNVDDISADLDQIRVDGKGRRQRVVPLCRALQAALRSYLEGRESATPALIVNETGRRMGCTTLYRLFRRVLKRAKLAGTGLTPHSLRHGFASFLIRNRVDIASVSELLSHSNISTTSIYLHADATSKREAVASLPWSDSQLDEEVA